MLSVENTRLANGRESDGRRMSNLRLEGNCAYVAGSVLLPQAAGCCLLVLFDDLLFDVHEPHLRHTERRRWRVRASAGYSVAPPGACSRRDHAPASAPASPAIHRREARTGSRRQGIGPDRQWCSAGQRRPYDRLPHFVGIDTTARINFASASTSRRSRTSPGVWLYRPGQLSPAVTAP